LRYCILGFTSLMLLWLRRDSVWLASAIVVGTLLFVGRSYPLLHSALVGLAYWQATKTVLLLEISFGLILLGIVGGTLHAAPRSLRQRMFWTNQFSDFAIVIWPVLIALPLYFF
ncbi:MAG TPA: hypothetical protein VJK52_00510, partial [Candidatus Nanoarchaeia archaeon]|nr:hypothetical protein [Candidatus Nanoarchaeia archaeon]